MIYVKYNGKRFDVKNNNISLRDQGITDISEIKGLNSLTNLISINLEDNKIEKIHGLDDLINLENLYLSHNQITEIEGLEKLLNLQVLALGGNQISEIRNISHLTNLKDLFINGNNLYKIQELDSFTNLQRLNLSYNKIRIIEGLDHLGNLYSLFLGSNKIKSIENLEGLEKLKRLGLSSNKISEIKGMDNLIELEHLDLNFNRILDIEGLQKLSNLRIITLSHNNIAEIKGLEALKISQLDLSYNLIKEIKGLDKLPNLNNLNIKNNPIIDREEFLLNRDVNVIIDFCKEKNRLIKGIIGDGEDETTEYKESFRFDIKQGIPNRLLKEEVTKAICAFLNKYGGELFIGVSDSGEIKGIERDLKLYGKKNERSANKDTFYQDITKNIRENLGTKVINLIAVDFIPVSNKEIVKVSIKHSFEPVFFRDSVFYIRDGPASIKMNTKESVNYIQSYFTYEKTLLDTIIGDDESNSYNSPKIKLALKYIDIFNDNKISYEKQKGRILFIYRQFRMLSNQSSIDSDSLDSYKKFIMFAIDVIENLDDNEILDQIYGVFLGFSSNELTKDYLKVNTYEIFTKFYNDGIRDMYIIGILVNFGFFDEIVLNEIEKAVQNNDFEFIRSLTYAEISRFDNYDNILERLIQIIENLDYDSNKNLVNKLEELIRKFQKIKFFN